MTPNQILFSQITDNLHAYNRLEYAIKLELDKPGPKHLTGLHQTSGDLLTERKFLLEAYSQANFVIFRCPEHGLFFLAGSELFHVNMFCEDNPNLPLERLLSNGEWQSETERQQENLRQYAQG